MPTLLETTPRCTVRLYKTISRQTSDGSTPVSSRYRGKDPFIDLTPFLGDSSSVRTTKSVREPAGGFTVTFTDQPNRSLTGPAAGGLMALESIYGLVEPMDVIEIRMWSGMGSRPGAVDYPVVMRGFVSDVQRGQAVSQDGRPMRTVTLSGQDYGKLWQVYQVLYLPAYAEGVPLLTSFSLYELFGVSVVNSKPAGEFVREMIQKVINPYLKGFLPDTLPASIPKEIKTGDSIAVKHGKVNLSLQQSQGSVYDILREHGDVGHWNELYTEDREDGVHCVYRPAPYLRLARDQDIKKRKIHDDAPDPIFCPIPGELVKGVSFARTDSNVVNFFWVNNSKFDLIDDITRRLFGIQSKDETVNNREYPNSSAKYYGIRPMYASTQQTDDDIEYDGSGLPKDKQEQRGKKMEAWIERRRRQLKESNQDNVALERGTATVKGCPMRPDGSEAMKAGDYARFTFGAVTWDAYAYQVEHLYIPYQEYTTTLTFDRGEGFARRTELGSGASSPWLAEQSTSIFGSIA